MKDVLQNLTKKFPNRNKKAHDDVIAVNDFTFESSNKFKTSTLNFK